MAKPIYHSSIEGAQQYVELLLETIEEVRNEVASDISDTTNQQSRRLEALRLVAHKLERLCFHQTKSRRLLNDLRSLRRLLLDERTPAKIRAAAKVAGAR